MNADLVINGGMVVSPGAAFPASVAIKDGLIVVIGDADTMPPARETLEASGLHVLPGAIDVHVHFRDPGYPHKEDWASGTAAAAFGGVTTVFEMPNTIPPTGTAEALADKHRIAAGKAHVDFGLYGLLGEDTIEHVPTLVEGGIIGFKLYMGNTFGNIPSPSTGAMLEAFEVVARTGKRVSLHAETASIMARREERMRAVERVDPLAHLAARPAVVAVEAVSRAAILAEWTGARIHILHISSAEELRPLQEAKARGVDITGETCPQYLMLSSDDYARLGGVIRVNPPVREARNQEPLWRALADGVVDMIATDHAPHTPEEKTRNDIWTVDCGFPALNPDAVDAHRGQSGRMSSMCAGRCDPAKVWGLYPARASFRWGRMRISRSLILPARPWSRCHAAPRPRSRPERAAVKGLRSNLVRRWVMKDRTLVEGTQGWGRSVRHSAHAAPAPEQCRADDAGDRQLRQ